MRPDQTSLSVAGKRPVAYETGQEDQRLRLLVMQPTSFCNLDCAYCYLPDRNIMSRMSCETVDAVFSDLLEAPFVGKQLTVVWHAGEPLVIGLPFYIRAVESSRRLAKRGCHVTHSIQTNATLINNEWCDLFKRFGFRVGVSLDGPSFLHDRNRKTRTGRPTHSQVMRGVECLRRNGVDFHVICVLTRESLDHAEEIFEFFNLNGVERLCFNIEEVEGANKFSSITDLDVAEEYGRFLTRFYELSEGVIHVREFQSLEQLIYSGRSQPSNTQCTPFAILSVAADGSFSSFSPELLSTPHPNYGNFTFGNINSESFISMLESPKFRLVLHEIKAGVRRCRESCEYFVLCGGGAPSNKVFENGTFDSAETAYCRLARKTVIDVCLGKAETELGLSRP